MAITFTDREMERAWRENLSASQKNPRTNAHRLLLFYAVECGLKAVLMRKKGINRTDLCQEITKCGHDLNELLECLYPGNNSLQLLKLPVQLFIQDIKVNTFRKKQKDERQLTPDQINQMWRYGGKVILKKEKDEDERQEVTDEDIEKKLLEIVKWIQPELQKP